MDADVIVKAVDPHPVVVGFGTVPTANPGSLMVMVSDACTVLSSVNANDTDEGAAVTGLPNVKEL